jgi:hypothetical protein
MQDQHLWNVTQPLIGNVLEEHAGILIDVNVLFLLVGSLKFLLVSFFREGFTETLVAMMLKQVLKVLVYMENCNAIHQYGTQAIESSFSTDSL